MVFRIFHTFSASGRDELRLEEPDGVTICQYAYHMPCRRTFYCWDTDVECSDIRSESAFLVVIFSVICQPQRSSSSSNTYVNASTAGSQFKTGGTLPAGCAGICP